MGEIHISKNDDLKIEDTGTRIARVHSDGGKEYEKLERLEDHRHVELHFERARARSSSKSGIWTSCSRPPVEGRDCR
jgi:hypothetical protein